MAPHIPLYLVYLVSSRLSISSASDQNRLPHYISDLGHITNGDCSRQIGPDPSVHPTNLYADPI
ncbi:hypothetical protein PILCRDRAFT_816470 [Piloderma croceum F 1598]|uniref:Uncharacterized protein n=1 Tax=Piloderma croceum (strain F 1598) TaxID=765440 RepID=A0A0C3FPC5_PILCF|nr:hypothetical protein PILCRDRAFT_816470 [Piloderma croceum F 1598]